jgi:hypothetical protein
MLLIWASCSINIGGYAVIKTTAQLNIKFLRVATNCSNKTKAQSVYGELSQN